MVKTIYVDNGATTRVDERAVEAMLPFFENIFGNPSSNHEFGFSAYDAVKNARSTIAKSIGQTKPDNPSQSMRPKRAAA